MRYLKLKELFKTNLYFTKLLFSTHFRVLAPQKKEPLWWNTVGTPRARFTLGEITRVNLEIL
jgi:hypothetical protein